MHNTSLILFPVFGYTLFICGTKQRAILIVKSFGPYLLVNAVTNLRFEFNLR